MWRTAETAPALRALLVWASRRHVVHLLFQQGIFAAAFGFGGLILLLLFGTQILDWYWPALLFTAAFAVGVYRFAQRMPSRYLLAQWIDRNLGLRDTLSTAYHFRKDAGPFVERQRSLAQEIAAKTDYRAALPFRMPRSIYASSALALAALTMLGVRYGVRHNLDLRPPVAEAVLDVFRMPANTLAKLRSSAPPKLPPELKGSSVPVTEETKDDMTGRDRPEESYITPPDIPDVNDLPSTESEGKPRAQDVNAEPGEGSESGEMESPSDAQSTDTSEDPAAGAPQQKGQNATKNPEDARNTGESDPDENSSLMEKMKDALANMLNKFNIKPPPGEGRQQAASKKGGKQGGGAQKMPSDKGGQMQARQQGESGMDADMKGDQQGEGAEQMKSASGKSGDRTGDRKASKEGNSGIGKADGDKDVKLAAEHVDAMGKLSEILGKRAQNIQGEVMVEVSAGKQTLKTQYSQTRAEHQQGTGEIHRDEVPLIHQQYVQQYFEEIHKASQAAPRQE